MLAKIMIVEDESIIAFNMQQRLMHLGYEVPVIVDSGNEALRVAQDERPDLVLMDIRIKGDIDGIETAARLREVSPVPVVYLTAYSEDLTLVRARATRPYGYLLKPFQEREMHATIQMALERHKAEVALKQSEEELRLAMDVAEMGIVHLDPHAGTGVLAGHAAEIVGLTQATATASCTALLKCVDRNDRKRVRAEFARSLRELAQIQIEFRRRVEDGTQHWVRAIGKSYSAPLRDGTRLIGVLQDITSRKQAEQIVIEQNEGLEHKVTLRTAELQATVAELDAFSYSVAHDLRSPLRSIVGFAELLLREHAGTLNAEAKRHLERLHASGLHMAHMIDSLLNLAHVSNVELRRVPVNPGTIAAEIAAELREEDPRRIAEFSIAREAWVHADLELVRIVIDNLMRNAWKYTSKRIATHIEFDVIKRGGEQIFLLRDNGAGFDMRHAVRLFHPFRRAHSASEFPGTGVGLATVQRIVRRHGGRIWAQSEVGMGATFYFTLEPDSPHASQH